jgi:hypothetical protein
MVSYTPVVGRQAGNSKFFSRREAEAQRKDFSLILSASLGFGGR